jgi:hypothetical protein
MKKLYPILLLFALLFVAHNKSLAQTKQTATADFLKALNQVLQTSKQQHWAFDGPMKIDSAFAINSAGILSVTVRYDNIDDSTSVRVRMEAPINKVKYVGYDLYLILEFPNNTVTVFESDIRSSTLKKKAYSNLFHIGIPKAEGEKIQIEIQQKLEALLKYFQ